MEMTKVGLRNNDDGSHQGGASGVVFPSWVYVDVPDGGGGSRHR